MKHQIRCFSLSQCCQFIVALALLAGLGCAHAPRAGNASPQAAADSTRNPAIQQIVASVQSKCAQTKGYTAQIESRGLDPNGGFDSFQDELTVRCPDRMLLKRKALTAHNADMVGQTTTIVIDGRWLLSRTDGKPATPAEKKHLDDIAVLALPKNSTQEERDRMVADRLATRARPTYWKTDLQAVAKAGGPSVRDHIAMTGNVADPFGLYRLDTLQLLSETPTEWVLLAEYREKMAPWSANRLTIDKATGFLKQVEAAIPESNEPVVLLRVQQVIPKVGIDDSLFKMDMPAATTPPGPYVSDNTEQWIASVRAQRATEGEAGKPQVASERP